MTTTSCSHSNLLALSVELPARRWRDGSAVFFFFCLAMAHMGSQSLMARDPGKVDKGHVAGYQSLSFSNAPTNYNAGFSMYVAAWPLMDKYQGHRFQSGLFGTWMFAQHDTPPPDKMYSDIEGGLGWWRDTRFPTETPKFIMGGVAPNFSSVANGPGHGWGTWDKPRGVYGVAQISPWLLFPLDGLNLKQGVCGELFGYGYLLLPLATAKTATAGVGDVPTGDNCWTLFLSTRNFSGPVAFFTPYFWSEAAVADPRLRGMLLDSRPSNPNKPYAMETQHIPCAMSRDRKGTIYARTAPVLFPREPSGDSVIMHHVTSYTKQALWDATKAFFEGREKAMGTIDPRGAHIHEFKGNWWSSWQICPDPGSVGTNGSIDAKAFATPVAKDPATFGYRWNYQLVAKTDTKHGQIAMLPEHYRLVVGSNTTKVTWVAVRAEDVPVETGLAKVRFDRPIEKRPDPYVTPDDPASCWKKPGPVAGPFKAHLGDGSVVTYYWYRFADQPALLNADLTDAEREQMQKRVVLLHRNWPKNGTYLPRPTMGTLAEIDPAQLVTPPKGFEYGYVPIATRQECEKN